MADDTNEDSWLYGTSNPDSTTNEENVDGTAGLGGDKTLLSQKSENEATALGGSGDALTSKDLDPQDEEETFGEFEDPAQEMEEDEEAAAAAAGTAADTTEGGEDTAERTQPQSEDGEANSDDEDDSDDDINVVIGDIKAAPSTYNIKQRANLLAGQPGSGQEKSKSGAPGGKFSVEDFEGVGTINGVPAHEFSIDSLEDKPWRKPGADITDYFNYGFNEETWRAYCERQKRFRIQESGVGLASLTQNINQSAERQHEGILNSAPIAPIAQGMIPPDQMQMPPPGILPPPQIVHHGPPRMGMNMPRGPRPISTTNTKENPIQVMTAECREYSRPGAIVQMPPNFGAPPPVDEPYFPEPESFDYGYEPTQESQWNNENPGWVPSGIKELTPGPAMVPPPATGMSGPPGVPPMGVPPPQIGGPPPQMRQHPPILPVMTAPNMGMGPPPPGMGMMMGPSGGPPMRMPMGPPRMIGPHGGGPPNQVHMDRDRHERERERDYERRDRDRDRERERDRDREVERERERERERDRERERPRRERSRSREKTRVRSKSREKVRDRERERERDRERDVERERERDRSEKLEDSDRTVDEDRERRRRERERERERERSRRERSRSRDKTRRRSKSREKERDRSSKTANASSSSNRAEKKKSHRKDKEDEE